MGRGRRQRRRGRRAPRRHPHQVTWGGVDLFVNIPVGIVVLALATRFVRESRYEDAVHEYDVVGALSVTSGLVLLVYAISEAPDVGWAAFRTIGLLVLSGALLLFFVWWESRTRAPLMPLGIFRNWMLTAANVVSFLQSGGLYGSFLLPDRSTCSKCWASPFCRPESGSWLPPEQRSCWPHSHRRSSRDSERSRDPHRDLLSHVRSALVHADRRRREPTWSTSCPDFSR